MKKSVNLPKFPYTRRGYGSLDDVPDPASSSGAPGIRRAGIVCAPVRRHLNVMKCMTYCNVKYKINE